MTQKQMTPECWKPVVGYENLYFVTMNAKEAKSIALSVNSDKAAKQIVEIDLLIKQAVEKGEMSCNYYHHVIKPVYDHYKSLGYSINNYSSQKDGELFQISWG